MADRAVAPSEEELQSFRNLRELLLDIIREIGGDSWIRICFKHILEEIVLVQTQWTLLASSLGGCLVIQKYTLESIDLYHAAARSGDGLNYSNNHHHLYSFFFSK